MAASTEGGKLTPELHRLHETLRRNLGKRKQAEPWSFETSQPRVETL